MVAVDTYLKWDTNVLPDRIFLSEIGVRSVKEVVRKIGITIGCEIMITLRRDLFKELNTVQVGLV